MDHAAAVEVLRRLYTALGSFHAGGDDGPLRAVLTEDVRWFVPGRNRLAGEYRGVDAVMAYFDRRRELSHRTFRLLTREILVGEDHLAALTDGCAVIGGSEQRWSTVALYRLAGDRIAECWLLPPDPAAFDALWG